MQLYTLQFRDGHRRRRAYTVRAPKSGTVLDLKNLLARECSLAARHLVVADVYQHHIFRYLVNDDPIRWVSSNSLFLFWFFVYMMFT
jgi:hypothetical protein